jgi:hypothetical protein
MAVRSLLHYALEAPDPDLHDNPGQCGWKPRDFPEADALYRRGPPVPDDCGLDRALEG